MHSRDVNPKTNWSLRPFGEKGPEAKHIGHAANAAIRSGLEDARKCLPDEVPPDHPGAEPGQHVLEEHLHKELKKLPKENRPKNHEQLVRFARDCLAKMAREHIGDAPVSDIHALQERKHFPPREDSVPNNKPPSLRGAQIKQSA